MLTVPSASTSECQLALKLTSAGVRKSKIHGRHAEGISRIRVYLLENFGGAAVAIEDTAWGIVFATNVSHADGRACRG